MADTETDVGKPLPPPKRGNSFGNLKTKTVREMKRPVGRPPNEVPLVAITCKLLPNVKDRFEAFETPFLAAREKGRRTDFVDALLAAFEASKGNGAAEPPPPRQQRAPELERKAGRTERRDIWFGPDVIEALESNLNGRTLSEKIANALFRASEHRRLEQENEELHRQLAELTESKKGKSAKAA